MTKNRFARLLLTGKVASLPMLIGQARADVTPTYSDMIGSTLRVIEVPSGTAIRLSSIAADAATAYAGTSSYAALICTNTTLPENMTIVVTGVASGESVVLAAASNKNDPVHLAIDSRLTLGAQGLSVVGSAEVGKGLFTAPSGTTVGGTVTITVPTTTLTALASNGKLYLQAAVIPSGATSTVASWRFSELDELQVGTCSTSSY
jgi:hypothetical protein